MRDTDRFATALASDGKPLLPGERVSAKRYPRGTIRGTVAISKRVMAYTSDGGLLPALVLVDDDGETWDLPYGARRLKR